MKVILVITLLIVIVFLIWRRQNKNVITAPTEFVDIDSRTRSNKHLPVLPGDILTQLDAKYSDKEFDPYVNKYNDITEHICNNVYSKSKYSEKNQTHADFLNELTNEQ